MRYAFLLLLALVVGCATAPEAPRSILPLAVGNEWQGMWLDSLWDGSVTFRRDTIRTVHDTVIDDRRLYAIPWLGMISRSPGGFDAYFNPPYDDVSSIRPLFGWPTQVGDTAYSYEYWQWADTARTRRDTLRSHVTTLALDREEHTPAGTFTCVVYERRIHQMNGAPVDARYLSARGVGVIQEVAFRYALSPGVGLVALERETIDVLFRPEYSTRTRISRWELERAILHPASE